MHNYKMAKRKSTLSPLHIPPSTSPLLTTKEHTHTLFQSKTTTIRNEKTLDFYDERVCYHQSQRASTIKTANENHESTPRKHSRRDFHAHVYRRNLILTTLILQPNTRFSMCPFKGHYIRASHVEPPPPVFLSKNDDPSTNDKTSRKHSN